MAEIDYEKMFAELRNIDTRPGLNAGGPIDPTLPYPSVPNPTDVIEGMREALAVEAAAKAIYAVAEKQPESALAQMNVMLAEEMARAAILAWNNVLNDAEAEAPSWLMGWSQRLNELVENYEFRDPDCRVSERDRVLLEDFGNGLLDDLFEAYRKRIALALPDSKPDRGGA